MEGNGKGRTDGRTEGGRKRKDGFGLGWVGWVWAIHLSWSPSLPSSFRSFLPSFRRFSPLFLRIPFIIRIRGRSRSLARFCVFLGR